MNVVKKNIFCKKKSQHFGRTLASPYKPRSSMAVPRPESSTIADILSVLHAIFSDCQVFSSLLSLRLL
jgi:hypothetical protein